jgi:hypothetical protein
MMPMTYNKSDIPATLLGTEPLNRLVGKDRYLQRKGEVEAHQRFTGQRSQRSPLHQLDQIAYGAGNRATELITLEAKVSDTWLNETLV